MPPLPSLLLSSRRPSVWVPEEMAGKQTRRDPAAELKRRKRVVALVALFLLLLGVVAVVLVFGGGRGWLGLGGAAPEKPSLGAALARYRFVGLFSLREGVSPECSVECEAGGCPNCVCPDRCAARGKRFMGLAGCDGARLTCVCGDALEDLVVEGSEIPETECVRYSGGCRNSFVHRQMQDWLYRLEPRPKEESFLLYDCGCKGIFTPGADDYIEDPENKVVCPETKEGVKPGRVVAIYERVARY